MIFVLISTYVGTFQTLIVWSGEAVKTISSSGWQTTFVTFFECPFKIATICSVSLLKTVAFLSFPPVNILLWSVGWISSDKIPGTDAECKPLKKNQSLLELL